MKKKLISLTLVILFLTFAFTLSHAALLGVEDKLGYPDITFGNGKFIYTYDSGQNVGFLSLEATDLTLTFSSGDEFYLSGNNYTTKLSLGLYLTLDNQKKPNFIFGAMNQFVEKGQFEINGKLYKTGDNLLSGNISAFGWGEGSDIGTFDFLINIINNQASLLVANKIWPENVPTGIYVQTIGISNWDGSWDKDFTLVNAAGDKAPVPIPGSILLLSSGFGLISLKRFRKKGVGCFEGRSL